MRCPKCNHPKTYVENSYSAGESGSTQRRVCESCGAVLVCVTTLVSVNPPRGQGAYSLAKKLRMKKPAEAGGEKESS